MIATKFHTAEEKEKALKKFQRFFERGCPTSGFDRLLYQYASNMFGHIAHFNMLGYYETWFSSPSRIADWLNWAERAVIFGDPAFGFSDVERAIQEWVRTSGIKSKYETEARSILEKAERAELARLKAKYEGSPA
jgi:hypothetical protein